MKSEYNLRLELINNIESLANRLEEVSEDWKDSFFLSYGFWKWNIPMHYMIKNLI